MMNYNIKLKDTLFFLLGFFSTFEIVQMFGISLFSCMLVLVSCYMILSEGKIFIKSNQKPVCIYIIVVSISECMVTFIELENRNEWITASLKKYILLLFLAITFIYVINYQNGLNMFLRGLYYSCLVEMIWCYLQFVLYKSVGIDINMKLFGMSHISSSTGQLILSGLNSNAGILVPALFVLILFTNKLLIKFFAFFLFFLSGTSTMVICGITVSVILGVRYAWTIIIRKNSHIGKKAFITVTFLFFAALFIIIVNQNFVNNLNDSIMRIVDRINSARTKSFTDGSTFTHTRYYTTVRYVWNKSNIVNVIFGYGIDCAGVPFVRLFKQYAELLYVPESDPITFLYNYGIVGFIYIYWMIISIIKKGRKVDWKYVAFYCSVVIGGLFYGMFLNWILLLTWISIVCVKEKKSIFNITILN